MSGVDVDIDIQITSIKGILNGLESRRVTQEDIPVLNEINKKEEIFLINHPDCSSNPLSKNNKKVIFFRN
jgi:hypothetical protein